MSKNTSFKKLNFNDISKKIFNKKLLSSTLAIAISFIVAIIVLVSYGQGKSIGRFFELMFYTPFANFSENKSKILPTLSILFFVGIAVATSFKGGMFNIGISGQMLMGGGMSMVIILSQTKADGSNPLNNWSSSSLIITFMITSAVFGALYALIPALLKNYFKIHEVISTLLLVWIALYFSNYLITLKTIAGEATDSKTFSKIGSTFAYNSELLNLSLIFSALVIFVILFRYQKSGLYFRLVGSSRDAAQYSGIKPKSNAIYTMLISGAFAGIAGFILYAVVLQQIPKYSSPPTEGYEGIVVALIGANNGFGIALSSMLLTLMKSSSDTIGSSILPEEIVDILIALMLLLIALSSIIINFDWAKKIKAELIRMKIRKNNEYFEKKIILIEKSKLKNSQKEIRKQKLKSLIELKKEVSILQNEVSEIKNKHSHYCEEFIRSKEGISFLREVQYINDKYLIMIDDYVSNNKIISNKIKIKSIKRLFVSKKHPINQEISDLKQLLIDKITIKNKIDRFHILRESELQLLDFKIPKLMEVERNLEVNKIRKKIDSLIIENIKKTNSYKDKKVGA